MGSPEGFWTVSARRAVKNPTGGSLVVVADVADSDVPSDRGSWPAGISLGPFGCCLDGVPGAVC